MSCVLSEELTPTPLGAVQVMMAKALSLITLVALRVLVTLNNGMVSFLKLVMTNELKSTPFMNWLGQGHQWLSTSLHQCHVQTFKKWTLKAIKQN